ncbi:hepatic and glial cell adhesion molecule-like [Aquarana catesbeiana]|uniref:hepatic and glial cell adhesion molecule-like n=1 Tax=Aquarana catesbeiana TaxID=8400 RepID=UPI003CC99808
MGYAILTATLLLLIQYGKEGAAVTINSNSNGNVKSGNDISLDISYTIKGSNPIVYWAINGMSVALLDNNVATVLPIYTSRLSIIGNGSLLLSNSTKEDTGNYTVTVTALGETPGTRNFEVTIYDQVVNVTVTQSPQKVNEGAAFVNLSCSSSSGYTEMVTWMKDGQSVISKNAYSLLDGNWTLQITQPDRTFNGLYICNVSNAAYWGSGSLNLTVSYATLRATSTYSMMIITLLGGIMLAH